MKAPAGPPRAAIAWGVPLVAASLFAVVRGVTFAPDSAAYIMYADGLIDTGFDYGGAARDYGSALGLTYALFVTLVAALKLLLGAEWPTALVAINVVAFATVGLFLTRLTWRLTSSAVASWVSLVLYVGCLDLVQWVPYILSDSTFGMVAYAVFLMEAVRLRNRSGRWLPVFAASIAASLYRPTGFILVPITAWSLYLARSAGTRARRVRAIAVSAIAAVATALAFGWLMQEPGRWPFGLAATEVRDIALGYREGQVVWDRPGTYHAVPSEVWDYWAISADRFLHFFLPAAGDFSAAHVAAQLAFYVPVYGLCLYFVGMLIAGRTGLAEPHQNVFYAAFGAIMAYAAFHAMVQVDYDWRYRVPVIPHLILLAAGGLSTAARRARPRSARLRGSRTR